MVGFQRIAVALNAEFPKPRVDSEWLEQCCAWIADEKAMSVTGNFREFFESVHDQLLKSDLRDSMEHGTGLSEISCFTGNLTGPPVLVQIMAIKEIGFSAFQLEQVRAAREERILAGVGNEEGEEDGDIEVEGEGPMPKYPRGTLHFTLSDGATEFEAMEYRSIPQLVLGVTKLGYKLQLNSTRFSNGLAFLEPATIKLIGGENAELHAHWDDDFKHYLHAKLMGEIGESEEEIRSLLPNFPRPSRAPLRDISPRSPTLHDDDIGMAPRRKRPSDIPLDEPNLATPSNPRSIKPLPTRLRRSGEGTSGGSTGNLTGKNRDRSVISVGDSEPPEREQRVQNSSDRQGSFDFDLLDELDGRENARPKPLHDKGKGRAVDPPSPQRGHPPDGYSSDYGIGEENMFADEGFWESLDRVEKEALEDGERSNSQSKSKNENDGDGHPRNPSASQPTPSSARANEVIELDNDSDEEADKENAFVPMRHVRRRTEDLSRGRSLTTNQNMSQFSSQRKNKASVVNTGDVIDISDSD